MKIAWVSLGYLSWKWVDNIQFLVQPWNLASTWSLEVAQWTSSPSDNTRIQGKGRGILRLMPRLRWDHWVRSPCSWIWCLSHTAERPESSRIFHSVWGYYVDTLIRISVRLISGIFAYVGKWLRVIGAGYSLVVLCLAWLQALSLGLVPRVSISVQHADVFFERITLR